MIIFIVDVCYMDDTCYMGVYNFRNTSNNFAILPRCSSIELNIYFRTCFTLFIKHREKVCHSKEVDVNHNFLRIQFSLQSIIKIRYQLISVVLCVNKVLLLNKQLTSGLELKNETKINGLNFLIFMILIKD